MSKCKKHLSILLALLMMIVSSTTAFAATELDVNKVTQAKTYWCWAACSEMIGRYQNNDSILDQWDVVSYIKGSDYPNTGGSTADITKGIRYVSEDTVTYTSGSTLSWASHKTEIDDSDPLIVWMTWDSKHAHVVVCAGYKTSGSTNYLYLIDPDPDATSEYYSYTALKNGTSIQSGNGKYTTSIYRS
jgi:hypothetical protein